MIQYPSQNIKAITEFLFIGQEEENLKPSDVVLVLGSDYIEGTMAAVCRLYQNKIIKEDATIVLSGATGTLNAGKELECNLMYQYAVEQYGMPEQLFVKEARATNTYQNFRYAKEILQRLRRFEESDRFLCIGKDFLLRRASMYAAKCGYPVDKIQYYGIVDTAGKNIGKTTWWENQEAVRRVMAEIRRIGEYGEKGDLSIF